MVDVQSRMVCWEWKGATSKGVPVSFHSVGRKWGNNARRDAWEFSRTIDERLENSDKVVTNCGNDLCMNPWHLERIKGEWTYEDFRMFSKVQTPEGEDGTMSRH